MKEEEKTQKHKSVTTTKKTKKKEESQSWLPVSFISNSPWKSKHNVQNYGKRLGWNQVKIEDIISDRKFEKFDMKKQRNIMKHHVYPRQTFIINYFFPDQFMYLVAINSNTSKALFSIPDEIYKRGNMWYVPPNPKASTKSTINSLNTSCISQQ